MHASHVRTILTAFAVAIAIAVAWFARSALLILYIAVVFAVVLSPAIQRIRRIRVGRWQPTTGLAILIAMLIVLAGLFILLFFGLPPIIDDVRQITSELPKRLEHLSGRLDRTPLGRVFDAERLQRYAGELAQKIPGILAGAAGLIASVLTTIILTAYLILDGKRTFNWAISLFPAHAQSRLASALCRGADRMRRWIVGQAMLMLILGSASAVVFGLMQVRYFYFLAVLAGVANIVPMVGPIVTVVIASLVAALDSTAKVLGVIGFYLIYQQVENAFLTPHIMQSQVRLSPVAVLVALILGAELAGIAGALVSVPTAALASVLISEYATGKDDRQ